MVSGGAETILDTAGVGILVWQDEHSSNRTLALVAFGIQLALNLTWSYLFFYLRSPWLGLVDIIVLWIVIGTFVLLTWSGTRSGAYLFLPYWVWVTYAGTLNFAIWHMNRVPQGSP
jgi:translocator protein